MKKEMRASRDIGRVRTSYTVNADPELHLDVRIRALAAELALSQGLVIDNALTLLEERTEKMALVDDLVRLRTGGPKQTIIAISELGEG